jgi:hypothetical protein
MAANLSVISAYRNVPIGAPKLNIRPDAVPKTTTFPCTAVHVGLYSGGIQRIFSVSLATHCSFTNTPRERFWREVPAPGRRFIVSSQPSISSYGCPIVGKREGSKSDVNLERLQGRSRAGVPQPDCVVARSRCQQLAVRREGHGVDRTRMALERLQGRSRAGGPQPDCVVARSRRQQLAVRREGSVASVSGSPCLHEVKARFHPMPYAEDTAQPYIALIL